VVAALVLGGAACSGSTTSDAGPDIPAADTAGDASVDAGTDAFAAEVSSDTGDLDADDAGADVAVDTGADVAGDFGADVAIDTGLDVVADGGIDVAVDTGADVVPLPDAACTGGAVWCGSTCYAPVGLRQIDVRSHFNVDVILNNGSGGYDPTQDAIDGSNYVALTQGVASALGGSSAVGLPNDGSFAANASHPAVQLAYRNDDNGNNAARVLATGPLAIDVPDGPYTQLQVFGISTEGSAALTFTLHYCDGTTATRSITFPDWFNDPPPAGTFYLIDGMDRAGIGGTYQASRDPAAFGVSLAPDATRVLVSVDVAIATTSTARFFLLGATGQ
jgi:hypothetical protein